MPSTPPRPGLRFLQAAVIVLAGWWIYAPALHGGWLWDDDIDITGNRALRDPAGWWKIWLSPQGPDYYPLKTTVQWIQWHLWGDHPFGYHVTNVGLHLCSAFLIWWLLRKLGVRLAWLGGLLFVVHPLAVESVAWIVELKNTLSLPLVLLAMGAYVDWDKRKNEPEKSVAEFVRIWPFGLRNDPQNLTISATRRYLFALLLFLAAMLCKSSVVMFPFILLLYAWWKRGRVGRADLFASVPFFAVSLILGLVTVWLQQHRAIGTEAIPIGGIAQRVAVAGLALAFYLSKCVLPLGLMPIYPRWHVDPPSLFQFAPWLAAGIVLWWLARKPAGWRRHALFGLGFFAINLVPVLGFVTVSHMRFTWAMDHLAYLPLVGVVGLAAAGASSIGPISRIGPIIIVTALLALESRNYAKIFRGPEALWTYAVQRNPDAWLARTNLGAVWLSEGRTPEAIGQFEEALRLHPANADAETDFGLALAKSGRLPEAIEHYKQALRIKPDDSNAENDLGLSLSRAGRLPEAIDAYQEALRIDPGNADAENNLGIALTDTGRLPEAISHYEQALRLSPDYPDAHSNLGAVLARVGRLPEAIAQYREALRIQPDYMDAYNNLGVALADAGRLPEAIETYEQALRINPNLPVVHFNLANALAQSGRASEATQHYKEALRLKPDFAQARAALEK